jgi:hypothetical protein
MSTKLSIAVAAAVLATGYGPAMAMDQSAVRQKTQALRQLGIQLQGPQRAHAEASGLAGRAQAQTPAYRPQNCLNLSGNSGPVQVCW